MIGEIWCQELEQGCCVNRRHNSLTATPYFHELTCFYMPYPQSGTYNKGPRIWRGGLSEGWGSHGGGNILKITGSHIGNTKSTNYLWVRFPVSDQCTPTLSQPAVTSCAMPTVRAASCYRNDSVPRLHQDHLGQSQGVHDYQPVWPVMDPCDNR